MNELESIEEPIEGNNKQLRTAIAWFFVIFSPFLFFYITVGFYWFKDWQGIVKFISTLLLSGTFILLILLLRKWLGSVKSTGVKILAIIVGFILSIVHILFLSFVLRMEWTYDNPVAEYEVIHADEKYTFYVCNAFSWQFFFDGGYEVWVHEPSSYTVKPLLPVVWKSEYYGEMEVSPTSVKFYFSDNNPLSKRTSGNTYVIYFF